MEPVGVDDIAVAPVEEVEPPHSAGLWERIRQMPNAERNYLVATCVLSLVLLVFVIAIVVFSSFGTGTGGVLYCFSNSCINSAVRIMRSMNSSADPCTDFYEFLCGGWKKVGGDEEDNWGYRRIKVAAEQAAALLSGNDTQPVHEAVKKAQSLYHHCMALDILDRSDLAPLVELLERAGLPTGVPNNETVADFDLSQTLARVHRTLGKAVLLDVLRESNKTFTVSVQPLDITIMPNLAALRAIHDWPNREDDNRSNPLNNSIFRADWQEFVKKVSNLVKDLETLKSGLYLGNSELENKMNFLPSNMSWRHLPASEITSILYNGTIPQNVSNTINYEVYMETLLKGKPDVNWTLSSGTIRLINPEYHSFLVSALRDFSPVQIQMLVWMEVIKHFGVYTSKTFSEYLTLRQIAFRPQPPRNDFCAKLVMKLMPVAVDHLFSEVTSFTDKTEKVTAMVKEIRASQRELVENSEWLDQMGLKNVLQHLDDIKIAKVGYIDWIRNNRVVDNFFKDVRIHEHRLLRTIADIQVWQLETNFLLPTKFGRLRTDPITADAFYYRSVNSISVQPITMMNPVYSLGLEALDYGAAGLIIGREFGHALDAEAFAENDYFSLEDPAVTKVDAFVNCTQSRIAEFSSKLKISPNPRLSIDEDIADINGVKAAVRAFNKIREGPEPHLPGLPKFSHDQLFFLSFGNVWCNNGKPLGPNVGDGPHYSNWLRTLSAVSNTPEFAEIWNCPAGSPMNPKEKCALW